MILEIYTIISGDGSIKGTYREIWLNRFHREPYEKFYNGNFLMGFLVECSQSVLLYVGETPTPKEYINSDLKNEIYKKLGEIGSMVRQL